MHCTLLATLVCFVHVCVAKSVYSDIRSEKRTSGYVAVSCKVSWDLFWIEIRNCLVLVGLIDIVLHFLLLYVYLFPILTDMLTDNIISFTIHRRPQSQFREANARRYNNNNDDGWANRIKDETTRTINTNTNNNNKKTNNNDQASHIEMAATTIHINSSNNNDDKSDSNDEASYRNNTNNR